MLVLITALTMQAITTYWLYLYRRNHSDTVAMQLIATTIHTILTAVEDLPSQERLDFVKHATGDQWKIISGRLPSNVYFPHRAPASETDEQSITMAEVRQSLQGLVVKLKTELSGGTRIALSRGSDGQLFVSIKNPRSVDSRAIHRDWLVIPINLIDPPVQIRLVTLWMGALAALTLVALWFSWHITRPITQLMDATDQLASGQPKRVKPTGPTETRILGERFNGMLDALASAESVKRTLLAGLPHDLKGPMTRMWLRIEMSDDILLKEGIKRDLEDMQHIAEQFIQYLRGTDGAAYDRQAIPMDTWVTERVNNWQSAGSDVTLLGRPYACFVMGDSLALSRLLDNLIENALHHGSPPVHISLTSQGQNAVLRVIDHGDGIPESKRIEAIEPFVRLDKARTRSGNVGLGLALAVIISQAHSGSLTLGQSATGGLEVQVNLPLMAPDQITSDSPSS